MPTREDTQRLVLDMEAKLYAECEDQARKMPATVRKLMEANAEKFVLLALGFNKEYGRLELSRIEQSPLLQKIQTTLQKYIDAKITPEFVEARLEAALKTRHRGDSQTVDQMINARIDEQIRRAFNTWGSDSRFNRMIEERIKANIEARLSDLFNGPLDGMIGE